VTTTDATLILGLRSQLEKTRAELADRDIMLKRAIMEHAETRSFLADLLPEVERMRKALRFYLDDDRRSVEAEILESIAARPAFKALGGKASGLCSAHREPSDHCRVCYPTPPRPRLTPPAGTSARRA
jgi:hypothetical protein